jgi:hypothetical protein
LTGHTGPNPRPIIAAPNEFAALAEELDAQRTNSGPARDKKPAAKSARNRDKSQTGWFDKLSSDQQSEVVRYAALHIANNSTHFELGQHGGDYTQAYLRLAFAIARSGVEDAEDIFVEAATVAKDADSDADLRKFFWACHTAAPPEDAGQ